jgi:hypothetical protein
MAQGSDKYKRAPCHTGMLRKQYHQNVLRYSLKQNSPTGTKH